MESDRPPIWTAFPVSVFRGSRLARRLHIEHPESAAQSGTYWYHSHSRFQEQTGHYAPLVIEPRGKNQIEYDRDYVIMLSDWTDEDPETIFSNLKQQSDYYNQHQRTARTFFSDLKKQGLKATVSDRLMWGRMNMNPTDILDVSGATYTYLLNGQPPAANWTALFARASECVCALSTLPR